MVSFTAVNLGLRFVLEVMALAAMAYWGWTTHQGAWRIVWAIGVPLAAAAVWGVLRVPGDPGDAPVAVPGAVRLLIEVVFFALAVWLLTGAGRSGWAIVLGALIVLHYIASYQRVLWLLSR